MNIVLCGMMGSGKTTVANSLSKIYNVVCVDTDEEITKSYGQITDIFARVGEEGFRDIESEIVERVVECYDKAVISLGGGCVLREKNVKILKTTGKIFYLRTSPEVVISRLSGDTSRPLLRGDLEERVRSLTQARSAIYERVADYIVDTDDKSPEQIAKFIMEQTKV